MDSFQYVNILADNLFASASDLRMNSFTFQQDNDPKHTSKLAKSFFVDQKIPVCLGQLNRQI